MNHVKICADMRALEDWMLANDYDMSTDTPHTSPRDAADALEAALSKIAVLEAALSKMRRVGYEIIATNHSTCGGCGVSILPKLFVHSEGCFMVKLGHVLADSSPSGSASPATGPVVPAD